MTANSSSKHVALKHRIVVIGAGSIGERHARCFLATGRAAVGIVEVNRELGQTVAARYGLAEPFRDISHAVSAGFSAAVVATPATMHIPLAQQLAQAGVQLLIEKPLAVELEGVPQLESIVRDTGVVAAVAYVYRANPALSDMRAAIHSGRFGNPVQIVATSGQHFPTYRPAYRSTYYANRKAGGGAIQDALTHVINAGEWLVGPVTRVIADAEHLVLDGVDVEDTVHVMARHGRVMASYALNQHQAANETSITVICERGTVRWELHSTAWYSTVTPGEPWRKEFSTPVERDTLFTRQANSFLDAIERTGEPLCTLAEGVQTLHVNLAVLRSVEDRVWQNVCVP